MKGLLLRKPTRKRSTFSIVSSTESRRRWNCGGEQKAEWTSEGERKSLFYEDGVWETEFASLREQKKPYGSTKVGERSPSRVAPQEKDKFLSQQRNLFRMGQDFFMFYILFQI